MATAISTTTAASRGPSRTAALSGRVLARAAIVLIGAALALAVGIKGAAIHVARSAPRAAAILAPYDGRAAVAAAQAEVAAGGNVASPDVRRLTLTALTRDATLTPAIEMRALQAEAQHDPARELRLFQLSSAISRRSLPTRLWLIQRSVDQGDVVGALENFDIALRTSMAAPDVLFPVLANASSDPGLAAPMARLLDRPEDWRVSFLHYAITEAHAGPGVAAVMLHMRDRRLIIGEQLDQSLIGELVSEHQFPLARQVHDAFGLAAGPDLVADPRFAEGRMTYPFGWGLIQTGTSGVERTRAEGRTALEYQVTPGGGGQAATQLLTLAPGDYRLTVTTARPASDPVSQPFWTLTCGDEGGGQLALLDQPRVADASAAVDFTVPADCTGQWLALSLRSSDDPNLTGAIREVVVSRRQSP